MIEAQESDVIAVLSKRFEGSSIRKVAQSLDIDAGFLSNIHKGKNRAPDHLLNKLGFRRAILKVEGGE